VAKGMSSVLFEGTSIKDVEVDTKAWEARKALNEAIENPDTDFEILSSKLVDSVDQRLHPPNEDLSKVNFGPIETHRS